MKIVPTLVLSLLTIIPFFAATVVAENDFARRLATAGSAGPDNLRSWIIDEQLGDLDGRNLFPNLRWKERNQDKVIIPYRILNGYFTSAEVQKIERLAQDLSDKAKVFQLVKRTNQSAYIQVARTSNTCWSRLGKQRTGKAQPLNLGDWCFNNEGTIPHEVRHGINSIC